jgi:hypothetical protein
VLRGHRPSERVRRPEPHALRKPVRATRRGAAAALHLRRGRAGPRRRSVLLRRGLVDLGDRLLRERQLPRALQQLRLLRRLLAARRTARRRSRRMSRDRSTSRSDRAATSSTSTSTAARSVGSSTRPPPRRRRAPRTSATSPGSRRRTAGARSSATCRTRSCRRATAGRSP